VYINLQLKAAYNQLHKDVTIDATNAILREVLTYITKLPQNWFSHTKYEPQNKREAQLSLTNYTTLVHAMLALW